MDKSPLSSASDSDLMRRIGRGDREALGVLAVRHQGRVLGVAYRTIGDRAAAEDVAQETFLRIWLSADRYKPKAKFTTWLYRVVVNLCLDALKKRAKDRTVSVVRELEGVEDAAARSQRRELAGEVGSAVAALPDRQRVAVVMHRFSGLPLTEIAEVTGWSLPAVESLLVRGYASLRKSLQEWEKK